MNFSTFNKLFNLVGGVRAKRNSVTGVVTYSAGESSAMVDASPKPIALSQSSIPCILLGNGTVATNGTVTISQALPNVYSSGAWVRLPAGAVSGGAAGLYFAVFSSATVGTVYTNFVDPATGFVPYIPDAPLVAAVGSNAAYTTTAATEFNLIGINIVGGSLGKNGVLRFSPAVIGSSTAGSKTYRFYLGAEQLDSNAVTTTTASPVATLRNKGSNSFQTYTFKDAYVSWETIDTSVDKMLRFVGMVAVSTDSLVIESVIVEVISTTNILSASPPVIGMRGLSDYSDYVNANTSKNLLTMVIGTDIHNGVDCIDYFSRAIRAACPHYAINLGDVLQQTDVSDGTNAYLSARKAIDDLIIGCNTNYIGLMGNHEAALAPTLRDSVFRNVMTPRLDIDTQASMTWGSKAHSSLYTAGTRPYWFFDDADLKVRFIHINPYYYSSALSPASNAELVWLSGTACNFSAKAGDATNWRIVFLTHGPLTSSYDAGGARTYSEPEKIMTALHSGGTYINAGAGINVTYSTAVKCAGHFFGDLHNDVRYTDATLKYQDVGMLAGRGTANFVHADYNAVTPVRSVYPFSCDIVVINLTDSTGNLFRVGFGNNFSWTI